MIKFNLVIAILLGFSTFALGNCETIRNDDVKKMVMSNLPTSVVLMKIRSSRNRFDLSTNGLIDLKQSGVPGEVIKTMMESDGVEPDCEVTPIRPDTSATTPKMPDLLTQSILEKVQKERPKENVDQKLTIERAKTIAFYKSSLHPSRQSLEKALLNRSNWKKLGLSIVRLRSEADLYVEIGYVSLSWLTHRYSYRVYDRRSGVVITAGETTSWGSLSKNLARSITNKIEKRFKEAGRIK